MVAEINGLPVDPSIDGDGVAVSHALSSPANGWPLRPFQIVSLLEMIEANVRELVTLIAGLVSVKKQLEDEAAEQLKVGVEPKEVRVQLAAKNGAGLLAWMEKAESVCGNYGIDIAYWTKQVDSSVHEPERYKTTLSECIDRVKHGIYEKLEQRKFMYMPDTQAGYYDQQELFGSEVSDRFPSANKEIGIAANCYATGNYTACVFHLTRALERALFVLAQDPTLGITIKDARDETWETLINKIESWLLALQKAPKDTPNKKLNLETYSGPALQFRYFKDHWRNPISHGRASYDGPQALSAIGKVQDLMESLVVIRGLKEEPGMIMP